MQILAVSLVAVVLDEIRGFNLIVGCFTPVFADLDRSRPIARATALGVALRLFGRASCINELENDFIKETRACVRRS